jgi:transcriptional regulator with XRE-family HTH domain
MTIPASAVHARWMESPEYAKVYEEAGPRMELAFQMAEARARAGLNQEQLAVALGTTQTQVSRWERGRAAPTADSLGKLAAATRTRVMLVPEEAVAAIVGVIEKQRSSRGERWGVAEKRPAKKRTGRGEASAAAP